MKIICPICKARTTWEENPSRPFCSERCRLTDLGGWASGKYSIPGKDGPEEAGGPEAGQNAGTETEQDGRA